LFGLVVALFSMPLIVGLFAWLEIPWTPRNVLLRELAIFACAGLLAFIIRRKERLGWDSVGLQRPAAKQTALWVLISIPIIAAALAVAAGINHLLGLPMGQSADASKFAQLPAWVLVIVIVRAGFVEEFCCRGYAIDRMQRLTGSTALAVALPLLLFAVFHYRQGWAGIIIAFAAGAVLSWIFLFKRNLWIGIIVHFLVDFIPNMLAHGR
jgi:membrane protease YdiL (CAAX protease family)